MGKGAVSTLFREIGLRKQRHEGQEAVSGSGQSESLEVGEYHPIWLQGRDKMAQDGDWRYFAEYWLADSLIFIHSADTVPSGLYVS